ncbi:potassium channel protein [Leptolyngbya sp. 'hensonii']|uniref:potassium channel family protein n=1 Tax=Leptolyngbya sp. 'hensonii' TaxID=1922337 RepID=UPI0009500A87|nr:potassium channel protein [Leptolyngbya sp. 'hensonii']OLP19976.1 potassium channel protein [Leptolyngbya sp. 'hensonii']
MQGPLRRVITGAIFFFTTIVVAIVGYTLAGWSILDASYMVVITVFGVGYGEVKPLISPTLKLFTMAVIVAGTTSAVYLVGGFVQMFAEGEIRKVLDERRMTMGIESLEQHVIICGFGRIGQMLAKKLIQANQPFVVIDLDGDRMLEASEQGYLVISGNATDEMVLLAAGITRAKALATVLPDDAFNVFITLTARELNPNLMILARGELPSTEKKLKLAGADRVVLPASIGAERMAHMITHPAALDFLQGQEGRRDLNELLAQIDIQLDELLISDRSLFVGRAVSDLEVRGKGAFIVVAVRKADGTIITHPGHDLILDAADIVIVMGHRGDIPQFARHYAIKHPSRTNARL